MEENVSPELSLAPEPEQSQDHMDSCSQDNENVAQDQVEEQDKSSKASCEVKKTWAFRRSTVAKREMPVEAAANSLENPCPVRRSGRQSKRTDKLEEFLSTAKRTSRKSAPPCLESGDPPSQTPTDAETASEASFDGNTDTKTVEDKVEPTDRRTRSSLRKQAQSRSQGGRQTRASTGVSVKDDGSSENEEDSRDVEKKPQLDIKQEEKDEKGDLGTEDSNNKDHCQQQLNSETKDNVGEKGHGDQNENEETEESDSETDGESTDKPAVLVKRGPIRTYINKKRAASKNTCPGKASVPGTVSVPAVRESKPKAPPGVCKARKPQDEEEEEEEDDDDDDESSTSSSSIESDSGYDPNALYCICRQKHNKRFMICCDRCEEWFHGDCVGITEARGRLMERNGEDYICPNCTAKKNQVVRPATSILSLSGEIGKAKCGVSPIASGVFAAASAAAKVTDVGLTVGQSLAAPPSSTPGGTEERTVEDQGIKGRIEKATNPTGKKKIKIFQPSIQQPAQPKADQKVAVVADTKLAPAAEQKAEPETDQKVASNVEVKTTPAAEEKATPMAEDDGSLPKCIGPGCDNNAQPDSVYCGNDCILRHAAAAMKSITDVKEPNQKDKTKVQKTRSTSKRAAAGGRTQRKSREDSDSDEDYSPDPDEDDEDEHAVEHPPPPATASWSSDHNYIAVTPEKTTPISPTVLNKKCMYLFKGLGLLMKPHCCFFLPQL